jgi:hypothetical protein
MNNEEKLEVSRRRMDEVLNQLEKWFLWWFIMFFTICNVFD